MRTTSPGREMVESVIRTMRLVEVEHNSVLDDPNFVLDDTARLLFEEVEGAYLDSCDHEKRCELFTPLREITERLYLKWCHKLGRA